MIQDINGKKYDISFKDIEADKNDYILIYKDNCIMLNRCDNTIPRVEEFVCDKLQYLFSIDEDKFFMAEEHAFDENKVYRYYSNTEIRNIRPMWIAFAAITGMSLQHFYKNNKFCGRCGHIMAKSESERAMNCTHCDNIIYPKISPAVIVAVTDGNNLLMTKYAGRRYAKYALVAGFVETGETLEDTVRREVFEEVGLKVKNIKYYKSQPWSFSESLLMGFFAELDGNNEIKLDTFELKEGKWFERNEIPHNDSDISLTNEMIELFRNGTY
ncbi:MAG: NAD(+) diphosphatase [Lachnospiraceae bacterium]|nr:NAD(+) diphosphatase [Lachnospiraceae bacterium]